MSNMSERIYCFHTSRMDIVKKGYVPAATVVLKQDGPVIVYGISICSQDDNFSRKYGREVAEKRMNAGFGSFYTSKIKTEGDLTDHQLCLGQLRNLTASVILKNRKWKKKIAEFNEKQRNKALDTIPSKP